MRQLRLLLPLAVAAIATILIAGGEDPYRLKVVYDDAAGLKKNYEVKIDGVPAGRISAVDLDARDRAVLTLELEEGAGPVGRGATAAARPVNLLGERYIDLDPGDLHSPVPSGSTIPVERTRTPVELDDIINVLDPGTRARLRIVLGEAGTGLGLRGRDLNALLDELPSSLDEARALLADVVAENGRLQDAIGKGDRVLAAVAPARDELGGLVDEAASTLSDTADRRRQLAATLDRAPAALRELRTTLDALTRTAVELEPAAVALRRTSPELARALAALPPFASDVRPTLRTAERVAPQLVRLGRRTAPEVRRLRPTVARVREFADGLRPNIEHLDAGGVATNALEFMHNWVKVIDNSDGLGHIFRIHIQVGRDLLEGALQRYGPQLQRRARTKGPLRTPRVPVPEQRPSGADPADRPSAPEAPAPAPSLLDDVDDVLQEILGPDGPLSGLAAGPKSPGADPLDDLLDYLLG